MRVYVRTTISAWTLSLCIVLYLIYISVNTRNYLQELYLTSELEIFLTELKRNIHKCTYNYLSEKKVRKTKTSNILVAAVGYVLYSNTSVKNRVKNGKQQWKLRLWNVTKYFETPVSDTDLEWSESALVLRDSNLLIQATRVSRAVCHSGINTLRLPPHSSKTYVQTDTHTHTSVPVWKV